MLTKAMHGRLRAQLNSYMLKLIVRPCLSQRFLLLAGPLRKVKESL